jgi:hypothetical protein
MNRFKSLAVAGIALPVLAGSISAGNPTEVIDFESLKTGEIVSQVSTNMGSGPVLVYGHNPALAGTNAAVAFDSANPTGGDFDLGTPNEDFAGPGMGIAGEMGSPYENNSPHGKVLILAENLIDVLPPLGCIDDPDDADVPGALYGFEFSALGPVTVHGMTLIDVEAEESTAIAYLFDEDLNLITAGALPHTGDNGVSVFPFGPTGVSGVRQMWVTLNGSGAIDDIVISEDTVECNPCIDVEVDCSSPSSAGGPITISGTVRNCGDVLLRNVMVYDDRLGLLISGVNLAPGQSLPFGGSYGGDLPPGACSTNTTTATGRPPAECESPGVMDVDMSECCIPEEDLEGCTPGYWKNHEERWDDLPGDPVAEAAGFKTTTLFHDFFALTPAQSGLPAGINMVDAASAEVTGGEFALSWHGIAALLNLAAGLNYDLPDGINNAAELKAAIEAAFIAGDPNDLKGDLEEANEKGCPLN